MVRVGCEFYVNVTKFTQFAILKQETAYHCEAVEIADGRTGTLSYHAAVAFIVRHGYNMPQQPPEHHSPEEAIVLGGNPLDEPIDPELLAKYSEYVNVTKCVIH